MSVEPVSSLIEFSRQNLADLILTNLLQNFWNQFLPAQLLLLIRSFSRLINEVKKQKNGCSRSHISLCVCLIKHKGFNFLLHYSWSRCIFWIFLFWYETIWWHLTWGVQKEPWLTISSCNIWAALHHPTLFIRNYASRIKPLTPIIHVRLLKWFEFLIMQCCHLTRAIASAVFGRRG